MEGSGDVVGLFVVEGEVEGEGTGLEGGTEEADKVPRCGWEMFGEHGCCFVFDLNKLRVKVGITVGMGLKAGLKERVRAS